MRNRLVSRLKDDKIHNRMLFEGARLTWEKTVELYFAADFQNNYGVKGSSAESISVHRVGQYTNNNGNGSIETGANQK